MYLIQVLQARKYLLVWMILTEPQGELIELMIFTKQFIYFTKCRDSTDVSPTIEMLRLWMDNGGWYQTRTLEWRKVHDIHQE